MARKLRLSWRTAALAAAAVAAIVAVRLFLPGDEVPLFRYRIVTSYPHDREAFTQGLAWDGERLVESTGLYGRSSLRRIELETGKVLQRENLPEKYFGEGVAVAKGRVVQLTWREGTGFVYDSGTFDRLSSFTYGGEGWGIAWDGKRLVVSDGTDTLRFLDPGSFAETGRIRVLDGGRPVAKLNELEYVDGEIWANVWQSDRIVRISPGTGKVTGWIDLTGLLPPVLRKGADVLNGIAWDGKGERLFVTGKRWPRLFQIEVLPQK